MFYRLQRTLTRVKFTFNCRQSAKKIWKSNTCIARQNAIIQVKFVLQSGESCNAEMYSRSMLCCDTIYAGKEVTLMRILKLSNKDVLVTIESTR